MPFWAYSFDAKNALNSAFFSQAVWYFRECWGWGGMWVAPIVDLFILCVKNGWNQYRGKETSNPANVTKLSGSDFCTREKFPCTHTSCSWAFLSTYSLPWLVMFSCKLTHLISSLVPCSRNAWLRKTGTTDVTVCKQGAESCFPIAKGNVIRHL